MRVFDLIRKYSIRFTKKQNCDFNLIHKTDKSDKKALKIILNYIAATGESDKALMIRNGMLRIIEAGETDKIFEIATKIRAGGIDAALEFIHEVVFEIDNGITLGRIAATGEIDKMFEIITKVKAGEIDKAFRIVESIKDESIRNDLLSTIVKTFNKENDIDKVYSDKAFENIERIKIEIICNLAISYIPDALVKVGEIDKAIEIVMIGDESKRCLLLCHIADTLNKSNNIKNKFNKIHTEFDTHVGGKIYVDFGKEITKSMEHEFNINRFFDVDWALASIVNALAKVKEPDKATEVLKWINDEKPRISALHDIAEAFFENYEINKAFNIFNELIASAEKIGDLNELKYIAKAFLKNGEFDKAVNVFNINCKNAGRTVYIDKCFDESREIAKAFFKAGDIDKAINAFDEAFNNAENIKLSISNDPLDIRNLIIQNSNYMFDDVVGMEPTKQNIKNILDGVLKYPNRHNEHFSNMSRDKSILLYSVPSCGKTFIGKAVAGEYQDLITFIHVKPRDFMAFKQTHEKLQRLKDIFDLAKNNAPSIVLWDEIEELLWARDKPGVPSWSKELIPEFIKIFQESEESDDVVIHIGTTNFPWVIDMDMLRSGSLSKKIFINRPDYETRLTLFELQFNPFDDFYDCDLDLNLLAEMTEGITRADIATIVKHVRDIPWIEGAQGGKEVKLRKTNMSDFLKVIEEFTSSSLENYSEVAKQHFIEFDDATPYFPELVEDINNIINEQQA